MTTKIHLAYDGKGRLLSIVITPGQRKVMAVVDQINGRFGRDTLRLAASGIERPWGMRQAHRSPRYTTRWAELARAY